MFPQGRQTTKSNAFSETQSKKMFVVPHGLITISIGWVKGSKEEEAFLQVKSEIDNGSTFSFVHDESNDEGDFDDDDAKKVVELIMKTPFLHDIYIYSKKLTHVGILSIYQAVIKKSPERAFRLYVSNAHVDE